MTVVDPDQAAGWAGTARLEPGMLSFAGRLGGTAAHAHAAVQVVTLTAGTVVFRDRYGGRQRAAAAIIPAGVVHAVEAPNPVDGQAYGTTCYLDPAGRAATAVAARVRAAGDRHQVSAWIAAAADTSTDQLLALSHDLGAQVTRAGLHPAVAAVLTSASRAIWAQVLAAVLAADAGITLVHYASHKIGVLWRFHAVHHSVRRFYGLNGLMKHPLHQTIEMTASVTPLLLAGLPVDVASALALAVAVQLLLQHSNADYRIGPAKHVLALNEGHRFHHLKWAGIGDVNFGLFTLIWDHLLRTYSYDGARRFTSDDLAWPPNPTIRCATWPSSPNPSSPPAPAPPVPQPATAPGSRQPPVEVIGRLTRIAVIDDIADDAPPTRPRHHDTLTHAAAPASVRRAGGRQHPAGVPDTGAERPRAAAVSLQLARRDHRVRAS
ncbi:sterol desaturase family protein [Actinomadura sp. NPDC047616]|uniref:sterol desaturase family protein n=1 Tax=Actinomadura sp. NPDC047616 TaxID=3155914 RepID=UPI0033D707F7